MPIVRGRHYFDTEFTQIPNAWVRDKRLSLKAKGLLAQIMSHAPGWQMSLKTLATANNCGVDAIRGAIDELMSNGYLSRSEGRERNDSGHLLDYVYVTQEPTLDYPTLENPTLENPTTKNNISKEEQLSKKYPQAELEGMFIQFWNTYPRKAEKPKAKKALFKALASTDFSVILAGAERIANDPNLPEKTFIPYPATWLNRDGWEDEPYPPRERSKAELEVIERNKASRAREADLARSRAISEEMQAARERATAVPDCKHGKSLMRCMPCMKELAEQDNN